MLAAEVGEKYSNTRVKEFCLEEVQGKMGLDFGECVKRSSYLIMRNYNKITKLDQELQLG